MHPPSTPLKVLLVDDHPLITEGLRNLLANQLYYQVVGEIMDGLAVYESCLRLLPDMVILDLHLPGMDGVDVIQRLRRRWNTLKIIVLTSTTEKRRQDEALAAGALSYIHKQSSQQILLTALKFASLGKTYIDPFFTQDSNDTFLTNPIVTSLTARESQILKLIAEGKRNRDIAELLSISLKTVESHRLNLMRKLDIHNAVELSHYAWRLGLVKLQ